MITNDRDGRSKSEEQTCDHQRDQPSAARLLHRRDTSIGRRFRNGFYVLLGIVWSQTACATLATNPDRPPPVYLPSPWSDTASTLAAIECAVLKVDGKPWLAKQVVNAEVVVSPGYVDRNRMRSSYQPKPDGSVKFILDADDPDAWHSGLRYEALCRWRLHILEGHALGCTRESWKDEIKPRYAAALAECRRSMR